MSPTVVGWAVALMRYKRALLFAGAVYLLACVGCCGLQRRLIYFPPAVSPEEEDAVTRAEQLEPWAGSAGDRIGWKRRSRIQPAQGRVLIAHGNACCAFECGHYADAIQQVASFDVYFVEYPGYADCPGSPKESSLYQSASEAFQLLATNGPVYLVGESLGTGVAAYLAGRYPSQTAGVVLLAPYSRLADVAQAHFPILPVKFLLRERFPAEEYLRNYRGPVAVLVGGRDRVVAARFGRRVYQQYAGPKRLWEFPDATHDSLMVRSPDEWKQIVEFWQTSR